MTAHHYHTQFIPFIGNYDYGLRSGKGSKMTNHTHKEECGQRVPQLEKDSQMNSQ